MNRSKSGEAEVKTVFFPSIFPLLLSIYNNYKSP